MKKSLKIILSMVAVSTLGWSVDISSWKSNYSSSEDVWIQLEDKPNNTQDWVGIYPKNTSTDWNNVIDWRWAKDTTEAQDEGDWYKFHLDDGAYVARFFLNNTFTVDDSISFTVGDVPPNKPKIKMSKDNYNSNEKISLNLSGELSGDKDWIGIYPKGTSNEWNNVVIWKWVKAGTNSLSSLPNGHYEARVFFHNSFDMESKIGFTVKDNPAVPQEEVIGARTVKSTPTNLAKLFASPMGNGDCMSYKNACNINTAISKLSQTNNVLFLLGGTYHINNQLVIKASGKESKPIIIESYPGENALLTGDATISDIKKHTDRSTKDRGFLLKKYVKIRKLEMTKFAGKAITIMRTNHVTIEGCKIHDNYASAISLYGASENKILDNITYNNSDELGSARGGNADGIQIVYGEPSNNNFISHNTVYYNSDDGIDTLGGIDTIITYNISYKNRGIEGGKNGGHGNGIGIKACSKYAKGSKVLHNITFENKGNGIECQSNAGTDVVFKYNTSYKNGGHGFGLEDYSRVHLSYNIATKNNASQSLNGVQNNNSWEINTNVPFVTTNLSSKNFLKPIKGSSFENMGVYVK